MAYTTDNYNSISEHYVIHTFFMKFHYTFYVIGTWNILFKRKTAINKPLANKYYSKIKLF